MAMVAVVGWQEKKKEDDDIFLAFYLIFAFFNMIVRNIFYVID